jgi:hypothetical protein
MSKTIILDPSWPSKIFDSKKPHQKYFSKDGTLLPGVTTALDVISKPHLIKWAAKMEREGLMAFYRNKADNPFQEDYYYEIKRRAAASCGTVAHGIAECFINSHNPEFVNFDDEIIDKGFASFQKFKGFWESNGFRLVGSEVQLVSEAHRYGGTIDQVIVDQSGSLVLVDLKTSNSVHPDHWSQVAAYRQLWNENKDAKINKCMIVRIGKEDPDDFEIQQISDAKLNLHWARFSACLGLSKINKHLDNIE